MQGGCKPLICKEHSIFTVRESATKQGMLAFSPARSAWWWSVTTQRSGIGRVGGRGYGDICIHITDSLCYTAETNTTL